MCRVASHMYCTMFGPLGWFPLRDTLEWCCREADIPFWLGSSYFIDLPITRAVFFAEMLGIDWGRNCEAVEEGHPMDAVTFIKNVANHILVGREQGLKKDSYNSLLAPSSQCFTLADSWQPGNANQVNARVTEQYTERWRVDIQGQLKNMQKEGFTFSHIFFAVSFLSGALPLLSVCLCPYVCMTLCLSLAYTHNTYMHTHRDTSMHAWALRVSC